MKNISIEINKAMDSDLYDVFVQGVLVKQNCTFTEAISLVEEIECSIRDSK